MKELVVILNLAKVLIFSLLFISEVSMVIQDVPYRFHYLIILSAFLPFLIISGIIESVFLIKKQLSSLALLWIIPVFFLFIGIYNEENINMSVLLGYLTGILVAGVVLFSFKKKSLK